MLWILVQDNLVVWVTASYDDALATALTLSAGKDAVSIYQLYAWLPFVQPGT